MARNFNNDMLSGINSLKEKRDEVSKQIEAEQITHNKLESELAQLNEKLSRSKANLGLLEESKDAYSKTITETEQVYNKIQESSQNLLKVIKRDSKAIQKSLNHKKVP